ncbi:hypothetical protein [Celerinatantimonas diazotrophica]|uniref:Uncharacterized protein n=1 Tax=Celerinatantimonas diazotrophica TaxID=412034 RepID=A0A4R1KB26_9GAMM|nr:hypothetical protein [Celerinatantimonas diazotrophica]TCK60339.1 hypothetical protein EV690_0568 [Celerinatantimonas diazotrophica]CAG9295103.1 hypothetical protein CEDIAZO_00215 [Celerinatantimonas diazotrophica]
MKTVVRILLGVMGLFFAIFAVLGLVMGGMFGAFFGAGAGSLMLVYQVGTIALAVLGLWSAFTGNRACEWAFSIILLPFWYVGTLIGAICIALLWVAQQGTADTQSAMVD